MERASSLINFVFGDIMGRFFITIEETVSKTFEVMAENEKQAKKIAMNNYNSGKFMLAPGELTYKQIQVCDDDNTLIDWEEF